MKVKDVMTRDPVTCRGNTPIEQVARLMVKCDCGAIPVVEPNGVVAPVGMITDRDIVCRLVAQGKNPLESHAGDAMTTPVVVISEEESVEDCLRLMREAKLRRVVVVDEQGGVTGIVTEANIVRRLPSETAASVLREIVSGEPSSTVH